MRDSPYATDDAASDAELADDQLRLIFTCCHPALAETAHAARADLLRCLGRTAAARGAYERALLLVEQSSERRFLERRILAVGDGRDAMP